MDTRTKQKHLRAVRLLLHALEGHRSSLPAGKSLATIIAGGMAAAQALGFDLIAGEERAKAGRITAICTEIDGLYGRCFTPSCGIERSCPRGDA